MLKPSKKEKSVLEKITRSDKISIDDDRKVEFDDRTTLADENTFLFDIQQSRTNMFRKDPDYKRILDRLDISPQLRILKQNRCVWKLQKPTKLAEE